MQVSELMTERPFTISPGADLAELYDLMDTKHVRHVPVVDARGRLLGLVSHRDLVKGALRLDDVPVSTQRSALRAFKVKEIMVKSPETAAPDDDLAAAGETMYENKFGCLPVVDGDRLVGILTEADFVRYVVEQLASD